MPVSDKEHQEEHWIKKLFAEATAGLQDKQETIPVSPAAIVFLIEQRRIDKAKIASSIEILTHDGPF